MFKNLSDQHKGSLLAFIGVMFITPDSLFIRLSNIDTPELRSSNINERQKAIAAKERLTELFYKSEGFFKLVSEGFDKYGRCIGQVLIDGVDASKTLIKEGYGVPFEKDN